MNSVPKIDFASASADWLLASRPPFFIGDLAALIVDIGSDIPGISSPIEAERHNAVRSSLRLNRKAIEKRYRLGRGAPTLPHSMDDDELKAELDGLIKPAP